MAISLLLILLIQTCYHLSHGVEYNYQVSDAVYGPLAWEKTYPVSCNGTRQSPIDIDPSKTTYDSSLGDIKFTNYDSVPAGSLIKVGNNGHSYRVFFTPNQFLVSGGGLPPGNFYTNNIHFHWGSDDTKGSEHTVNGKKYPAELHFVNVNMKYPNTSEALKNADGIAALGVFLEIGDENPALKPFLKYTINVTKKSPDIANLTMTQALRPLLPNNTKEYFRYDGSLTTPTCQEVVTWTVFKNHQTISLAQLNMLRSLKQDNVTSLTDTYRPVQPLNSRVVKTSFPTTQSTVQPTTQPSDGIYHVAGTMTTIVSVVMAIVMLYK